ncbi:MAG: amidohydrolase [Bacteroidales bacterium]|nr:amidohydrolase [Bacteroidales bacterium]
MKRTLYTVSIFLLLLAACGTAEEAELVIRNGRVLTVDENFSVKEAVAVLDGKILFTGSNRDIEKYIGPGTDLIDAAGLTVLPGLIDSHAHLVSLGDELYNLNISDCNSFDEIVERVAARVAEAEAGEWITGGRWDHTEWPSGEFPVHDRLSAVSPDNPVYLKRVDGNSAFVNKKAMELAGISLSTEDPPGGKIVRKANGEPTGILINQAMNSIKELAGNDSEELFRQKLALAMEKCVESGLTSVHEAGVGTWEIDIMKRMAGNDQLTLRINAMLGEQEKPVFETDDLEEYFRSNKTGSYANDYLCVNRIKLFFDGALGSRGAAFFDDYDDDPGNRGLLRISPEYISEVTKAALACGMSVATHCIGIRGNSLCLDAYEKALSGYDNPDHRLRIEHAQVVREEDIERFARLGIIPAMQAIHCTSDKDMIVDRIGRERSGYAYAWRSFIDAGLPVPGGSDFPVEPENPFMGIFASVTRRLPGEDASAAFNVEQCMTREEAIKSYTSWAALSGFQEAVMGSIEPGKWADFTIIDRDILTCDPDLIPGTKVIYTIVGGVVKYKAAGQ